jgi:hypothetical protein
MPQNRTPSSRTLHASTQSWSCPHSPRLTAFLLGCTLLATLSLADAATRYSIKSYDVPLPHLGTILKGINAAGLRIGTFEDGRNVTHGFRGSKTKYDLLPLLIPEATNRLGHVVGWYHRSVNGLPVAYASVDPGTLRHEFITLYGEACSETKLFGMNDIGDAVGVCQSIYSGQMEALIWLQGQWAHITPPFGASSFIATDINDAGTIIGTYHDSQGYAIVLGESREVAVPGATWTMPWAVNNHGHIAGDACYEDAYCAGFILINGDYQVIRFPGAVETKVRDITNDGYIAGHWWDTNARWHGFIATPKK